MKNGGNKVRCGSIPGRSRSREPAKRRARGQMPEGKAVRETRRVLSRKRESAIRRLRRGRKRPKNNTIAGRRQTSLLRGRHKRPGGPSQAGQVEPSKANSLEQNNSGRRSCRRGESKSPRQRPKAM